MSWKEGEEFGVKVNLIKGKKQIKIVSKQEEMTLNDNKRRKRDKSRE